MTWPPRKIVQIVTKESGPVGSIVALCDDGTVWSISAFRDGWTKLPALPEEPEGWGEPPGVKR